MTPELHQPNYAQLVVEMYEKDDTPRVIPAIQEALSTRVAGAWVDARQLQTNPVPYPVRVFVRARAATGAADEAGDIDTLRRFGGEIEAVLRGSPHAARARSDWGRESFLLKLDVDPDLAALAGVSNRDVADSSTAAFSGIEAGTLDSGNLQIPIVARLRPSERSRISDVGNLYVFSPKTRSR